tara:strand:+ start:1297 stop:1611 length:315 start_codon:yes stop_codon:yes gene_type:complete
MSKYRFVNIENYEGKIKSLENEIDKLKTQALYTDKSLAVTIAMTHPDYFVVTGCYGIYENIKQPNILLDGNNNIVTTNNPTQKVLMTEQSKYNVIKPLSNKTGE